jgi:hypothetical protein
MRLVWIRWLVSCNFRSGFAVVGSEIFFQFLVENKKKHTLKPTQTIQTTQITANFFHRCYCYCISFSNQLKSL